MQDKNENFALHKLTQMLPTAIKLISNKPDQEYLPHQNMLVH